MDKEPKKILGLKYIMKRKDIMTFVSGLHDLQAEMIEMSVVQKEREGFPEARAVIDHIKSKL